MKRPLTKKDKQPQRPEKKRVQKQKSAEDIEKERKKEAREEKRKEKQAQIATGKAMASKLFSSTVTATYSSEESDESDVDSSVKIRKMTSLQKEVEELKALLRAKSESKRGTKKVSVCSSQFDTIKCRHLNSMYKTSYSSSCVDFQP